MGLDIGAANDCGNGASLRRGRFFEASRVVGHGDEAWRRTTEDLLQWRVKTRSGFTVLPADERVRQGARPLIRVLGVHEPVEVVEVVRNSTEVGFRYRALPGHPVQGEEVFVVHREGDAVRFTVRSVTCPSERHPWRALWPLLLIAQRIAHRRYLRALR